MNGAAVRMTVVLGLLLVSRMIGAASELYFAPRMLPGLLGDALTMFAQCAGIPLILGGFRSWRMRRVIPIIMGAALVPLAIVFVAILRNETQPADVGHSYFGRLDAPYVFGMRFATGMWLSTWAILAIRQAGKESSRWQGSPTSEGDWTMSRTTARLVIGIGLIPLYMGLTYFASQLVTAVFDLGNWYEWAMLAPPAVLIVGWWAVWYRQIRWTFKRYLMTGLLAAVTLILHSDWAASLWLDWTNIVPAWMAQLSAAFWFFGTAWLWRARSGDPCVSSSDLLTPADPLCPRCGYSLRGMREVRCPECGWSATVEEFVALHVARSGDV